MASFNLNDNLSIAVCTSPACNSAFQPIPTNMLSGIRIGNCILMFNNVDYIFLNSFTSNIYFK